MFSRHQGHLNVSICCPGAIHTSAYQTEQEGHCIPHDRDYFTSMPKAGYPASTSYQYRKMISSCPMCFFDTVRIRFYRAFMNGTTAYKELKAPALWQRPCVYRQFREKSFGLRTTRTVRPVDATRSGDGRRVLPRRGLRTAGTGIVDRRIWNWRPGCCRPLRLTVINRRVRRCIYRWPGLPGRIWNWRLWRSRRRWWRR